MKWRKITADQYRKMEDPEGDGWDEVRFVDPETGCYREIWDCGIELVRDKVAICTAAPHDTLVDPDYPVEVR